MPTLAMVSTFTEGLPPGAEPLQWAVPTPSSSRSIDAHRGNLGLADQESKPPWLSKPGHLSYCRHVFCMDALLDSTDALLRVPCLHHLGLCWSGVGAEAWSGL